MLITGSDDYYTLRSKKGSKKHCCFYCKKLYVEISSHLTRQHSKEPEMLAALQMDRKDKVEASKDLRLKGDYYFNDQIPYKKRITVRKLIKTNASTCVSCLKCKGLIQFSNFARHERMCTGRNPNRKHVLAEARIYEAHRRFGKAGDDNGLKDKLLNDLLDSIRQDSIGHIVRSDSCLILLAERYAYLHRNNRPALRNDRQHLRRLARLLEEMREVDPSIIDFEDCILN